MGYGGLCFCIFKYSSNYTLTGLGNQVFIKKRNMSLTGIKMVLRLHWGNHLQGICALDYSVIKDRKGKIQLPFLRNTYLLLGIFEV